MYVARLFTMICLIQNLAFRIITRLTHTGIQKQQLHSIQITFTIYLLPAPVGQPFIVCVLIIYLIFLLLLLSVLMFFVLFTYYYFLLWFQFSIFLFGVIQFFLFSKWFFDSPPATSYYNGVFSINFFNNLPPPLHWLTNNDF